MSSQPPESSKSPQYPTWIIVVRTFGWPDLFLTLGTAVVFLAIITVVVFSTLPLGTTHSHRLLSCSR